MNRGKEKGEKNSAGAKGNPMEKRKEKETRKPLQSCVLRNRRKERGKRKIKKKATKREERQRRGGRKKEETRKTPSPKHQAEKVPTKGGGSKDLLGEDGEKRKRGGKKKKTLPVHSSFS